MQNSPTPNRKDPHTPSTALDLILQVRQQLAIHRHYQNQRSDQWRQTSNNGLNMKHSPTNLAQPFSEDGLQEAICAYVVATPR